MPASKSRAAMKGFKCMKAVKVAAKCMKVKKVSTIVRFSKFAGVPSKMKAEAPKQKLESDIARVVCCSNLMTGMTAELNLLSGGNGSV